MTNPSTKLILPSLINRKDKKMQSLLDGFTFDDIEYLVDNNAYLRGYLRGYLAELRLEQTLRKIPGVSKVTKIPDQEDRKGDFEVIYLGETITIECKSVEANTVTEDVVHGTWKGSVCIKTSCRPVVIQGTPTRSSYIQKGTFDLLAISTYAVDGTWGYLFMENKFLPESVPGFASTKLWINPQETAGVTVDVKSLMDKVLADRLATKTTN